MAITINADGLARLARLVVSYIGSDMKIECIRQLREITNLGLKESKDLIEAVSSVDPVLRKAREITGEAPF